VRVCRSALPCPRGDVDNNQEFSEAYKDVVLEQTIKFRDHNTNTKFIDYSFRLGGVMKFIVETKKQSSNIADDARSALQVRRGTLNFHSISSLILKNGPSMIARSNPKTVTPPQKAG